MNRELDIETEFTFRGVSFCWLSEVKVLMSWFLNHNKKCVVMGRVVPLCGTSAYTTLGDRVH